MRYNCRFAISLMDTVSGNRPVKLKVWNERKLAYVCREESNSEVDTETVVTFPFVSHTIMRISFTVASSNMQVSNIVLLFYLEKHLHCVVFRVRTTFNKDSDL